MVESEDFQEQLLSLFESIEIWDEIKWFVEQYLVRDPEAFELIPGTNLRAVPLLTDPPLTLYFQYEPAEECIYLISLL